MKKFSVLILIAMLFSLIMCSCIDVNSQEKERNEYLMKCEKRFEYMGAILGPGKIENVKGVPRGNLPNKTLIMPTSIYELSDEEWVKMPWYANQAVLSDLNLTVSLDNMDRCLYTYKMMTKANDLCAKDIIELYKAPNEQTQAEFDDFWAWCIGVNGDIFIEDYENGVIAGYKHYQEQTGQKWNNKELIMLTADEEYELAKWMLENPDKEYVEKILNNPEDASKEDIDYFSFLEMLDVVNVSETDDKTIIITWN